ncbi:MAG: GDSL-type esterase/lipase family protein [Reichenbachiella sp.]|uniref:GDSL-type esterase/lipase family protein n=1 Tax=Reichenbachiella sp. TaxID=2184521 RepID=UPI00329A0160
MSIISRHFCNLFLYGIIAFSGCDSMQKVFISPADETIAYAGRIDSSSTEKVDLYWPGSSVRVDFEGDSLFAILKDEKGANYFNVIIDQDSVRMLRLDTLTRRYLLAARLPEGTHSVELFKRTEWDKGKTTFFGFELIGNGMKVSKPKPRKRKMEFYGNSITAGYAVDDLSGMDRPDSIYTNHYVSYASIVARHYQAEYHTICKSGIGVMISWFPLTMPELYDRLIPEDSTSQWDFAQFRPDVVVVNLMQNDSWLVERPEHPQFQDKFGETKPTGDEIILAYRAFIEKVRVKHPSAHIICLLGNMDITQVGSLWPEYVEKAISKLDDKRVYTHVVPYKETPGHPNRDEQKVLAESLISFIDANIKW